LEVGRAAGAGLRRLRLTVLRRPALHDVRDEEVGAVEADLGEDVVEVPPGRADEGVAAGVLVLAGPLPHEKRPGAGPAVAGDGVGARGAEGAERADADLRVERF